MSFTKKTLNYANSDLLNDKSALVLGIDDVGGYAVEILAKANFKHIILADTEKKKKKYLTMLSSLMKNKMDVLESKIKKLNPECEIIKITELINTKNIDLLFDYNIDYIIDACEVTEIKKAIIRSSVGHKVKLVTSTGTLDQFDPSKLQLMEINTIKYEPVAKKLLKMMKDEQIHDKIMVVCTDIKEEVNHSKVIGSCAFIPSTAGLLCASYIIDDIIGSGNHADANVGVS